MCRRVCCRVCCRLQKKRIDNKTNREQSHLYVPRLRPRRGTISQDQLQPKELHLLLHGLQRDIIVHRTTCATYSGTTEGLRRSTGNYIPLRRLFPASTDSLVTSRLGTSCFHTRSLLGRTRKAPLLSRQSLECVTWNIFGSGCCPHILILRSTLTGT